MSLASKLSWDNAADGGDMSRERQKSNFMRMSEDGDALAERILGDILEEDGLPPVPKFKRGDWVVIFTGAFFHVGRMLGEDHEYISLEAGHSQIWSTGSFEQFFGKGIADHCETVPTVCLIRKGPITHIAMWPHARPAILP